MLRYGREAQNFWRLLRKKVVATGQRLTRQVEDYNLAYIDQAGNANDASISQGAYGNTAMIIQKGSGNKANITQYGTQKMAIVVQRQSQMAIRDTTLISIRLLNQSDGGFTEILKVAAIAAIVFW